MKQLIIAKLRVNVKSLAEEARIVRKEFIRTRLQELDLHRRGRIRLEARYAQLALAFIRERKYRNVEANARIAPDADRLRDKLRRSGYSEDHGDNVQALSVVAWLSV